MSALENFINHRQALKDELNQFIDLYIGEQPEIIRALADKINHICISIGSPSSVPEMLKSIVNGKKKSWYSGCSNTGYLDRNGVKVNPYLHCAEIEKERKNGQEIISGHFRWNFKGYLVDRETRDYINDFFIKKDLSKLRKNRKMISKRFSIKKYTTRYYPSGQCATIEITTTSNNSYRYHYYPLGDRVSTNYRNIEDPITKEEHSWVKKILLDDFPVLKDSITK